MGSIVDVVTQVRLHVILEISRLHSVTSYISFNNFVSIPIQFRNFFSIPVPSIIMQFQFPLNSHNRP